MGFEPLTFGTTGGHATADLGIYLGDIEDMRTTLVTKTHGPLERKCHWTGVRTRSSWVDLRPGRDQPRIPMHNLNALDEHITDLVSKCL